MEAAEYWTYGAALGLFCGLVLGYMSGWIRGHQVASIDLRKTVHEIIGE